MYTNKANRFRKMPQITDQFAPNYKSICPKLKI